MFKNLLGVNNTVNVQKERNNSLLVIGSYFIGILLVFFIPASLYMLWGSIFQPLVFFIAFPMIGIVSLAIYYFNAKGPLESLNRLFLIDLIIFLLYFICIFLIFYTLVDPRINYFFYLIVLLGLKSVYFILIIPLGLIIVLTYYYIKLNFPIGKIKLSLILIFLGAVITVFIMIFYLLDWSIPILTEVYRSNPDFGFDLTREFHFFHDY